MRYQTVYNYFVLLIFIPLLSSCGITGPDAFTVTDNPELVIPEEVHLPQPSDNTRNKRYRENQKKVRLLLAGKKSVIIRVMPPKNPNAMENIILEKVKNYPQDNVKK